MKDSIIEHTAEKKILSPDKIYLSIGMKMSVDFNAGRIPDYKPEDVVIKAIEAYHAQFKSESPEIDKEEELKQSINEVIQIALKECNEYRMSVLTYNSILTRMEHIEKLTRKP